MTKRLEDYPTPESDKVFGPGVFGYRSHACRSLERRLAACREALDEIRGRALDETIWMHPDDRAKGCVDDILEWSEQALNLTEPQ